MSSRKNRVYGMPRSLGLATLRFGYAARELAHRALYEDQEFWREQASEFIQVYRYVTPARALGPQDLMLIAMPVSNLVALHE